MTDKQTETNEQKTKVEDLSAEQRATLRAQLDEADADDWSDLEKLDMGNMSPQEFAATKHRVFKRAREVAAK